MRPTTTQQTDETPSAVNGVAGARYVELPPVDRRTRRRRTQRAIVLYRAALGVLTVLFAVSSILWIFETTRLERQNDILVAEYRKLQIEFRVSHDNVELLKDRIAALTRDRIPGLLVLTLDEATQFTDGIVQSVIFSLTGVGSEKTYDYRLVLRNQSNQVLESDVQLLLFDKAGIQIGSARVSFSSEDKDSEGRVLQPGETRSFVGTIDRFHDNTATYFLVIDKNQQPNR